MNTVPGGDRRAGPTLAAARRPFDRARRVADPAFSAR
jgi:hypothetical protein